MSVTSLCKIACGKDDYYLMTSRCDGGTSGFKLTLSDGENTWCGLFDEDDLEESCRKLKMDYDEYVSQTCKALTRENVGALNFIYQVTSVADVITFRWRKFLPKDKIKIQLGATELTLQEDSKSVICKMLDQTISRAEQQQQQLQQCEAQRQRLVAERTQAIKKLDKLATVKDDVEKDLYAKFAVVVNEKKAKIRALRQEMEEGGTAQSQPQPSTSKTSRPIKREVESPPRNSDSEYETDDGLASPPIKKSQIKQEVQDTVDDLLGDLTETPPGVKQETQQRRRGRGRRGGPSASVKTPSRPAIPKVSSARKSASKRSMTKSSSNASSNDMDNIDAMFDDI